MAIKYVHVGFTKEAFESFKAIKGKYSWEDVIRLGISAIESGPVVEDVVDVSADDSGSSESS